MSATLQFWQIPYRRTKHGVGRLPASTQEWILTLARRGWCVAQIGRAVQVSAPAVAGCLDAWGVARRRVDR